MKNLPFFFLFLFATPIFCQKNQTVETQLEIARQCQQKSDFEGMETAARAAVEAASLLPDSLDEQRLEALLMLGNAHFFLAKYANAEQFYRQNLRLREQNGSKNSPKYVRTLTNLAIVLLNQGRYPEAEKVYLEVKTTGAEAYGKRSIAYAQLLNNLGIFYNDNSRFDEAQTAYAEARDILQATPEGRAHLEFVVNLHVQALLDNNLHRYEAAEKGLLQALELLQKNFPASEKKRFAQCLDDLGFLYLNTLRFHEAEKFVRQAKEIREQLFGRNHRDVGNSLWNLADLQRHIGNFERAKQHFAQALGILRENLGDEHPDFAQLNLNFADAYLAAQQPDSALILLEFAQKIYEKTGTTSDFNYFNCLESQARTHQQLGNDQRALALFQKTLQLHAAAKGTENEVSIVSTLSHLGNFYFQKGQYVAADSAFRRAHDLHEQGFGTENHGYAARLTDLAKANFALDRRAAAAQFLQAAAENQTRLVAKAARHLSAEEMLQFLDLPRDLSDHLFSLLETSPDDAGLLGAAFDQCLFFKSFVLDKSLRLERHLAAAPDSLREICWQWKALQRRAAQALAASPDEREDLAPLAEQSNFLEKKLLASLPDFAENQVRWRAVQQNLRAGEAAVEFVRYHFFKTNRDSTARYAALILLPDGAAATPMFVPLCSEADLSPRLAAASNFFKINALYKFSAGQRNLYDLIWQPLEKHLGSTTRVFCAAEGLLHRLNLGAIALPDGRIFSEKRTFTLLDSTRELAEPRPAASQFFEQPKAAFLAGGIRYELPSGQPLPGFSNQTSNQKLAENARDDAPKFLPETAVEVSEISKMLGAAGWQVRLDSGFSASESAVRRQIFQQNHSPAVVHLATHGYFFSEHERSAEQWFLQKSAHPMLRSGLFLAGSAATWRGAFSGDSEDDGILTAHEISQLDLKNTELVVLSACQTGLGEIRGSEGVFGLRRAFKIAGSRHILMSLWKVNDQTTRELMVEFYRRLATERLPVGEAFRGAQAWMRAKYPAAPFYWAGFLLVE